MKRSRKTAGVLDVVMTAATEPGGIEAFTKAYLVSGVMAPESRDAAHHGVHPRRAIMLLTPAFLTDSNYLRRGITGEAAAVAAAARTR